jgi:hypothetical protein
MIAVTFAETVGAIQEEFLQGSSFWSSSGPTRGNDRSPLLDVPD